ncbi:MAG: hypothetical protein VW271_02670, partial [Chloroflexota bacterium]
YRHQSKSLDKNSSEFVTLSNHFSYPLNEKLREPLKLHTGSERLISVHSLFSALTELGNNPLTMDTSKLQMSKIPVHVADQ